MKNPVKRRQWKDLGSKPSGNGLVASKADSRPYYPSLYLDSDKIGVISADIGDKVTFVVEAEVVSFSKGKDSKISYSFDLKKLKVMPNSVKEESSFEDSL